MQYDVIIVGGGPAGLAAGLTLGRARKRVLLCDSGPRRNATAAHIQNFVTRDGTPPEEFRRIGREQLRPYPSVEVRDAGVESITGSKGAFRAVVAGDELEARRIILCTGMIDEVPNIEGMPELWGQSVFQCPYCHGWESKDRIWGYLARAEHAAHLLPFVLQLRGWTEDVVVFTDGAFELPEEVSGPLLTSGIRIESSPVVRLRGKEQALESVELSGGALVSCQALFLHPQQRQTNLVSALELTLDIDGFIQVDPMRRETSVLGIFAAGDATTRMQAAIVAAAQGMQTAAMVNVDLAMESA